MNAFKTDRTAYSGKYPAVTCMQSKHIGLPITENIQPVACMQSKQIALPIMENIQQ